VAAGLILAETWRSARSQSKRRDSVDDQLEELGERMGELTTRVDALSANLEERWGLEEERYVRPSSLLLKRGLIVGYRNIELTRILERIVDIGLRGGWAEFEENPIQLPVVPLLAAPDSPPDARDASSSLSSSASTTPLSRMSSDPTPNATPS
jgi:hypothetical protein